MTWTRYVAIIDWY